MLTFNAPAPDINGAALARQLADNGLETSVVIDGGVIYLANLQESDRAAVLTAYQNYQTRQAERKAIIDAVAANQNWLAANPTADPQVRTLTEQMNGLAKLLWRKGVLD